MLQLGIAPYHLAAIDGPAFVIAPDELECRDAAFEALVVDVAVMEELKGSVFADLLISQHLSPGSIGHQAGRQVDVVAHRSILAALGTTHDAGISHAHGGPHPVAQAALLLQRAQALAQKVDEFQGPLDIVLERNRRSEKADHDATFVAKIDFFEIAREVVDLLQGDGSKSIEQLMAVHPIEGDEDGNRRAELPILLVLGHRFGQKAARHVSDNGRHAHRSSGQSAHGHVTAHFVKARFDGLQGKLPNGQLQAQRIVNHDILAFSFYLALGASVNRQSPEVIGLVLPAYNAPIHRSIRQAQLDADGKIAKLELPLAKEPPRHHRCLDDIPRAAAGLFCRENCGEGVAREVGDEAPLHIHQPHQRLKYLIEDVGKLLGARGALLHQGLRQRREAGKINEEGIGF